MSLDTRMLTAKQAEINRAKIIETAKVAGIGAILPIICLSTITMISDCIWGYAALMNCTPLGIATYGILRIVIVDHDLKEGRLADVKLMVLVNIALLFEIIFNNEIYTWKIWIIICISFIFMIFAALKLETIIRNIAEKEYILKLKALMCKYDDSHEIEKNCDLDSDSFMATVGHLKILFYDNNGNYINDDKMRIKCLKIVDARITKLLYFLSYVCTVYFICFCICNLNICMYIYILINVQKLGKLR